MDSSRVNYKAIILVAGNSGRWQRSTVLDKETSDTYYWKNINREIEKANKIRSSIDKIDLLSPPIQGASLHKCFAGIGGQTILGRIIDNFEKYGIKDIGIITSKKTKAKHAIKNRIGDMRRRKINIEYIEEPVHYEVAHSMYYALRKIYQPKRKYEGNVIISFSDIVWKGELLKKTMNSSGDISLLVDTSWQENNYSEKRRFWHDKLSAEIVFLDGKGNIEKISEAINRYEPKPEWSFNREDKFKEEVFDKSYGEIVGLFKFTYKGANAFVKEYKDINKEFDVKPWYVPDAARKEYPQLNSISKYKLSDALTGCFFEYLNTKKGGGYVKLVDVDEGWSEIDCWGDVEEAERKVALWGKDELKETVQPVPNTTIKNKRESAEKEHGSLQEIVEVLKNWQNSKKTDKDFEAAKLALSPIAKTFDILCRCRGQCGAKTTNIISWLGSAANDGSGYCRALLNEFANPEVIADLENWQEKPAETEQGNKGTKREREGFLEPKPPETLAKILWIWKYGRQHWKLVCVGILLLLISCMFALPKFNLFGNKYQGTHSENENTLHKPIVTATATVEIAVRSEEQVNARHPYQGAVLAFVKGKEALLLLSSKESTAKQMGMAEVRYSSELDMKPTDKAFKQPLSLLEQVEYAQVRFEIIPPDSEVLSGTVICIFNNNIPIELSVPSQKMLGNLITIRHIDIGEALQQHIKSR